MCLVKPGTTWPGIARQVISAENFIYKREDGCKVFTIVFRFKAMVPMMILRGSNYVFQKTEVDTGICMNQNCMHRHKDDVRIKGDRRKAKYIQRNKRHGTGYKNINEVRARPCKPIHVFGGMMNRMKTPQVSMTVKEPVCPILEQVSYKKGKQYFKYQWQRLHPFV